MRRAALLSLLPMSSAAASATAQPQVLDEYVAQQVGSFNRGCRRGS